MKILAMAISLLLTQTFVFAQGDCPQSWTSPGCLPPPNTAAVHGGIQTLSKTAYAVGMEANRLDSDQNGDLLFKLPPHRSFSKLQGTLSLTVLDTTAATCRIPDKFGEVVAILVIDGRRVAPMILKVRGDKEALHENVFVNYDVPVPYFEGSARLMFEAWGCPMDVEFQGILQIK